MADVLIQTQNLLTNMNNSTKLFAEAMLVHMKEAVAGKLSFQELMSPEFSETLKSSVENLHPEFRRDEVVVSEYTAYIAANTFKDPAQTAIMKQSYEAHKNSQN